MLCCSNGQARKDDEGEVALSNEWRLFLERYEEGTLKASDRACRNFLGVPALPPKSALPSVLPLPHTNPPPIQISPSQLNTAKHK